jgi:hypothetical protein
MAPLTAEDITLLGRFHLTTDDVYDAQFMPTSHWKPRIRQEQKRVAINVSTCKRGHRLRTRSGHCAHCNNSKQLAHQQKYKAAKYVYVAGSHELGLIKVGSTTDHTSRKRRLNQEGYGGAFDWKLLYALSFQPGAAGPAETSVHRQLREDQVPMPYLDTYGRQQYSRELFRVNASRAAFLVGECRNSDGEEFESDYFDDYDFCGDQLAPELDVDITNSLHK